MTGINIFCAIGLTCFAILAAYANISLRKELKAMSPEDRKAFFRSSYDEMAIW